MITIVKYISHCGIGKTPVLIMIGKSFANKSIIVQCAVHVCWRLITNHLFYFGNYIKLQSYVYILIVVKLYHCTSWLLLQYFPYD